MLIKHSHKQFATGHQLSIQNSSKTYTEVSSVSVSGVVKMMQNLKSGQVLGPDGLRKADLSITSIRLQPA